jgi:hypothetical protein
MTDRSGVLSYSTVHSTRTSQLMLDTLKPFVTGMDIVFFLSRLLLKMPLMLLFFPPVF